MTSLQPAPEVVPRIALPWVVRLRYAMALGQIATVVVADRILHIRLPLGWIAIPPALVILSNVWLARRPSRQGSSVAPSIVIGWLFVLDTICLTAVLMLTGGPNNPFSLLYLVHITLSATILDKRQTWALGGLATFCFALLFWKYRPIAEIEMHHGGGRTNLHLVGMWIAFAVAAFLVAMFSGKISELLRAREDSLLRLQEELAKRDRLAALVTLAAGAAHELNTPLGTIAIVAKELERYATQIPGNGAVVEDSRLIRMEVDRCREILRRMSIEGAEPAGEAVEAVDVGGLLESLRQILSSSGVLRIKPQEELAGTLMVPRRAVEQALLALVKNAMEASPPGLPVDLSVAPFDGCVRFAVKDQGDGMSSEVLRHIGEPFFTTKDPGKGMGLGIFLVQTLADRLGGRLTFESSPGAGTSVALELPCVSNAKPVAAHE